GCFHAIVTVREIDLVQVHLEDLLLGELALDAAGDDHLRKLPPKRAGAGEAVGEYVAGELHGDGARPLAEGEAADVAPDRARHPAPVDSGVLVEAGVLAGLERGAELRGQGWARRV